MKTVAIQPRFGAWREAARRLLTADLPPEQVLWEEAGAQQPMLARLAGAGAAPGATSGDGSGGGPARTALRIPARFIEVAESVACHRDPQRWALMYRVLWRIIHGERKLMHIEVDDDVRRMMVMDRQVQTDRHKMLGFVRFQQVSMQGEEHYIAHYRPAHYILRLVAGWFTQRMAHGCWSILTPDESVHFNGSTLEYGPGVEANPNSGDELESLWKTYYASVFNPARLTLKTMRNCMPAKYWDSMPETQVVPELVQQAHRRVAKMIEDGK